jgi:putative ABC transport system permease protein
VLQDLRYACRSLFRNRLVSMAAVLALGLGIGSATAVFSVVHAVLLRPLPYPGVERLVRVWELTREGDRFSFSEPNFLDLRARLTGTHTVAAYRDGQRTSILSNGSDSSRLAIVPVSATFPDVVGIAPHVGRFFSPDEDQPGAGAPVLVLGEATWRGRFGADPQIVGRTVRVDDQPHEVIGVMPSGVAFPGGAEAWIPLAARPDAERDDKDLAVIGRLGGSTTIEQFRGELAAFGRQLSDAHPRANDGWSLTAIPFDEWLVAPRFRDALRMLLAAVSLLLLLACANIANLLIAQAVARQRELRIKAAVGATRARLVRQLFTESVLLAVLGTALGVLIAAWCLDLVQTLGAGRLPRLEELRLDPQVLAFSCLAGGFSCLLFGMAPALHATRVDLRVSAAGAGSARAVSRIRSGLIVAEVALAFVLVIGAGLLTGSFVRLTWTDPGFETRDLLAVPVELPQSIASQAGPAAVYIRLLEQVRAVPGVMEAGATSTNPFRQSGFSNNVTPEDRAHEAPATGLVQAGWRSVTPGYFEAMRIRLRAGRTFTDADRDGGERVVVLSGSLAERLWPNESAVGKRVYWGGTTGRTRTVIGVVEDVRDVALEAAASPVMFLPHAQIDLPAMTILVRAGNVETVTASIRHVVQRELGPTLTPSIEVVAENHSAIAAGPRFNLLLLATFAAIALALAVTGVYAVLAFSVAERQRELALRLALGSTRGALSGLVLKQGITPALIGVGLGAVLAVLVTRLAAGLLYEIRPTDPATFVASAVILIAVATIGALLPAHRASRIDPAILLKD